ncbi:MAG: hypothetical protein EBS19_00805, partial [Spirochaetia bacterium]|nr:hypothetical protein [Spirochaetia bacterium]
MAEDIGSRIDNLLGKDFSQMTTEEILSIISGGQDFNIPYDDLQSEEGFNKELEKSQKEVDSIIKSLNPQPLPISIKEIEELSCKHEGDDLYSMILIESVKRENPKLYDDLLKSDEYKNNSPISENDLGVKIPGGKDLGFSKKIPSDGITKYLKKKNPDFLQNINEKIFDNLDPLLLGKPSNSGSRKKRKMNVLGFDIPLEFIMNKTQIVHVKIGGDEVSIDGALEKINGLLKKQNENSNPCDFKDIDQNTQSERIDAFDSNFFPDGNDPIVDDDCLPGIPEDPITGDPILTKSSFDDVLGEFCDPPVYEFKREEVNNPEPPTVDVNAIDACVSSALEKGKKLEDDVKLLARWQMIERNLEEILYHYEAIYEYQKSLYDNWLSRVPKNEGGDQSDFQIGVSILTYKDQILTYQKELINQIQNYNSDKKIFLNNNNIFTENLFLLDVYDTELNDSDLEVLFNNQINSGLSPVNYNDASQSWPVTEGITKFKEEKARITSIMIGGNFISIIENKIQETQDLLDSAISLLSQKKNAPVSIEDVEKSFLPSNTTTSDVYGQGNVNLDINERVFKSPLELALTGTSYTYDSY